MKKKDLVKKWLDNEQLTKLESEAFEKLSAYDSYMKISETAKKFRAPEYNIENNLQDLNKVLSNHKPLAPKVSYTSIILKIAAIFVLSIGTYFTFFNNSSTVISTLAGEKTTVELPDQSTVILNSLTSVDYNAKDWEENRAINLDGEAYFKVAKGQKFDVHTSSGIVSVLGTQFNVKQRQNYFEVYCYEGLVSVTYNNETIKLPAGTGYKVINDEISDLLKISSTKPDWTENQSRFTSTPYLYVLNEFERQYDINIIAKNIDQTTLFTGNFVHSDIQTALQAITIPMRLKFEIKDNNITLTKE
ncbi:FecR family protein [Aquimarina sp. MMG016]|uniref:FecR family protein n=1 Tax=Aquimarina sp. MMG016 TaxID=2822690 RepID=UPI001B3A3824|nr:FecR family protein [Aquimarina sp. MMG016]MBQ4821412.1 FecR family protein [Aquimarina sp. MMG016]